MRFNTEKCKVLHFGHTNKQQHYFMKDSKLSTTKEEKDLGVLITDNLKPSSQCTAAVHKTMSALRWSKRSFHYLDIESFRILYKTYIRPNLEFVIQAWSPYLDKDIKIMEKIKCLAHHVHLSSSVKSSKELMDICQDRSSDDLGHGEHIILRTSLNEDSSSRTLRLDSQKTCHGKRRAATRENTSGCTGPIKSWRKRKGYDPTSVGNSSTKRRNTSLITRKLLFECSTTSRDSISSHFLSSGNPGGTLESCNSSFNTITCSTMSVRPGFSWNIRELHKDVTLFCWSADRWLRSTLVAFFCLLLRVFSPVFEDVHMEHLAGPGSPWGCKLVGVRSKLSLYLKWSLSFCQKLAVTGWQHD